MIDRLCTGTTLPVTDIQGNCVSDIPVAGGGSKKANAPVFSGTTAVYYRVTIRVLGPRNTTSMVQALLSR
jgi:type IV pilus assembly protein PilX